MKADEITLRVESDISRIPAAAWNQLARGNGESDSGSAGNPFISHQFLHALEASGCVTAQTGWLAQHLVLEAADGRLVGACPAYLKAHSQGEYVFDHGWAEAYERAGGNYYPKIQVSVPFTPATGPRLLALPCPEGESARRALAAGLKALAELREASSVHATFLNEDDARLLEDEGFLPRLDQQFHWTNNGYASFEDFLGELASRKRKAIRKERREAVANGIEIVHLTGKDITEEAWDTFFRFYMDTGARKWGRPYLNRDFYIRIGETMAERVLLVMAKRQGRFIAGAINFIGDDTLYGRHWGAIEEHPFLHFEVCYHQAIDFAISRGLARVEAGAQGEHKLARGYLPVTTRSAHFIADPGFREAVEHYLARERRHVMEAGAELSALGPFHRDADAS